MSRVSAIAALGAAVALAAPAAAFDPWQDEARYEFTYRVAVDSIQAAPGQTVSLWFPLAVDSIDQEVSDVRIEAPFTVDEEVDDLGNRMARLRWTGPAPAGATVVVSKRVVRRPSKGMPVEAALATPRDRPDRYLGARKRIPLDGLIEQIAVQESRDLSTDGEKIRAFYDYVVENMRYAKVGEGWGQGDAIWACTEKYGNCTDFHSLFLGMARSQGIPARFVIGFPIAPDETAAPVGGYHCWAEAWDPERGWVPFDASEAWKARRFDDYFGTLPSDRIAFTIGRDLVLAPPQQADPLNYFIYPYAEVDGQPVEKVAADFSFRRLDADTASAR
ncbi:MAG: transglutaminase-like domain-containing protein [Myxococcota bacterium]